MTIGQELQSAAEQFRPLSDSPELDAEVLLAHILYQPREWLLTHTRRTLTAQEQGSYRAMVGQRSHGLPVAYITGRVLFGGLPFAVSPDVLIPRPATELLLDAFQANVSQDYSGLIADIGTGSGAIIVTLLRRFPLARGLAVDISAPALATAKGNAMSNGVIERLTLLQGSLLEPFPPGSTPDAIFANLPYLTPEQMQEPSLQHEPAIALLGGRDGLDLIRNLLAQLAHRYWHGHLLLEFDPTQQQAIISQVQEYSPAAQWSAITDGQAIRGMSFDV